MIYLELFWSFFQIGLFSIGGGYAAMPLIQHQVVETHAWLTMTQFADIITIAEMTPGPIAVNSATLSLIHISFDKQEFLAFADAPNALCFFLNAEKEGPAPQNVITSTLIAVWPPGPPARPCGTG